MNNLPVIPTPVFPRYIWMEEITFSHIPIATIITAFMILAPIYELIGLRKQDPRYDRFARSLIWFSLIIFSPGAALGTGIPMVIIGLYPEFWARWANLFFWPLMIQFVFFLLEVTFLFFFYYLVWDRWQDPRRKRLHIAMGFIAASFGLLIQFVWDAVGGYMHTPNGVELPGALEAVGWNAQAFFNPSFVPLTLHRFFGNISYTMLLVGGVFAIKHTRAKDPGEHSYYGWASDLAFKVGFIAFFAMPVIGWYYSSVLQAEAPVAFNAIMGGHTAKYFNVKMAGIAFFVAVASVYVFVRHREKKILLYVVTALLASLYIIFTMHPPIDWVPGPAGCVADDLHGSARRIHCVSMVPAEERQGVQHLAQALADIHVGRGARGHAGVLPRRILPRAFSATSHRVRPVGQTGGNGGGAHAILGVRQLPE